MSKSIARSIATLAEIVSAPLGRRQRDRTMAQLSQELARRDLRAITTRHGIIHAHALRSTHTAGAIRHFFDGEPETLEWMDLYLKPGDTLWDIGANIGLYSLYAALMPGVKVYAFEPSALNFALLVENIRANPGCGAIVPLAIALSDKTEIAPLHMQSFETGHAFNAVNDARNQFESFGAAFTTFIPAVTADAFRALFSLPAPAHIKLDVDGIEPLILKGAPATLAGVRSVLVEVEGDNEGGTVHGLLADAGFTEDTAWRTKGSARNRLFIRP